MGRSFFMFIADFLLFRQDSLRPPLGNVGVITALSSRVTSLELTTNEFTAAVKALTSFSAESVNRIKLRESGALKVFVKLLASDSSHHKAVHDHIVNALPRYSSTQKQAIVPLKPH